MLLMPQIWQLNIEFDPIVVLTAQDHLDAEPNTGQAVPWEP